MLRAFLRPRVTASTLPRAWPAVLIRVGESENGKLYTAPRLRGAVERGLFESRPVNSYDEIDTSGRPIRTDHLHLGQEDKVGRAPLNQVGFVRNAKWDPTVDGVGGVVADVVLLEGDATADRLQAKLVALESARAMESIGLSIEGFGMDPDGLGVELDAVHSVDVVTFAAAGGRIRNRIAASRTLEGHPMKSKLLARLRESAAALVAGLADSTSVYGVGAHLAGLAKADRAKHGDAIASALGIEPARVKEAKEDELPALIHEAAIDQEAKLAAPATTPAAPPPPPPPPVRTTESDPVAVLQRRLDVAESRMRLERALQGAHLPEPSAKRLRESNLDAVLSEADATRVVESERTHVNEILEAARGESRVTVTRTSGQRLTEALSHMLNPTQVPVPKEGTEPWFGSFREFVERNFLPSNMRISEAVYGGQTMRRRIRESIDSTNFDNVFEDALRRSTLAAYQGTIEYSSWQQLVRKVPLSDFRTHRIVQVGYYGTLPTVTKGSPYLTLTTPTDREETIALAKKGGLEEILLEDVLNDDLQLFQTMVARIGQAAMETAFETVMALFRVATQPTLQDTYKLTSASRSPVNQGTAVLSADATGKTNLIASMVAMMKGTGGSGQKKGVIPKFLVIPFEKVEAAATVLQSIAGGNTTLDVQEAVQKVLKIAMPTPVIDYGATNTTDWFLLADPARAEVIRFCSLGGRDEPEIFLADDQRFGSVFTHDKTQLKVRFIYQAAAVDFLGIYGNDAAS